MAVAQAAVAAVRGPRVPAISVVGFGLIWAFLILFLLYPLTRIFYDAFTNEAGQFTVVNFQEFFTDRFYLRSLWNSLVLGVAAVNGESGGERNHLEGKISFAAYLGNTLRYDVDLGSGVVFKADVGDPWHHEQLAMGKPVILSCPVASTLAIPAD